MSEDIPDQIKKPEGYDVNEGNPDSSTWKVIVMPDNPKLWQIVDNKNMKIAHKLPDIETALQYVDWGRANRRKSL